MKPATIRKRLAKDRPMVSVTFRMPADVIEDLKRLAPLKGFTGYQALMRAYVGAALREDLERYEGERLQAILDQLRAQGVSDKAIKEALRRVA